jgi:hypothetical protein
MVYFSLAASELIQIKNIIALTLPSLMAFTSVFFILTLVCEFVALLSAKISF